MDEEGDRTMILEAAMLHVRSGMERDFEEAFRQASKIISRMDGYRSHHLHRCLEVSGQYLLLVQWVDIESHTVGFRQSADYHEWKRLLHHFYDPFPMVEHFEEVIL